MPRIEIELPPKIIFRTSLEVRIYDINYGGHTGNDSILKFIHEARMQFLKGLGIKDEISISDNVGIIISDIAVEYKSESFYKDKIEVKLYIDDYHKYGFDMYYLLNHTRSGKEIARSKSGILFFDYSKRKIALAPKQLINQILALPAL